MRTTIQKSQFEGLLTGFRKDAFRLETRPQYLVESEAQAFASYCRGDLVPPPRSEGQKWWDTLVQGHVAAGKTIRRVHVLPDQLTPYLRFEIEWGYTFTATAGEDIWLLLPDSPARLRNGPIEDFWLFDDAKLVFLVYDADGRFLRLEADPDPAAVSTAARLKLDLLAGATPLREYVRKVRGVV